MKICFIPLSYQPLSFMRNGKLTMLAAVWKSSWSGIHRKIEFSVFLNVLIANKTVSHISSVIRV